jgi:DUF4097 and DUF4098 domain-containing protein YvlB
MDANAVYLDNSGQANIAIDSSQPITLRIESPNGNITVRGDARTDVLVSSDDYDLDDDEFPLVSIEARGNVITIKPNAAPAEQPIDLGGDPESMLRKAASWISRSALGRHSWPDFTVEIPRHLICRLDAHAASGDIEIEDVTGTLTVRTASGDLHLVRIVGQLTAQSASGDISLENSVVALTARTASGDLHINETVLDGVHAQTASGDCYVEGTLRGGRNARVETASGDVHFSLEQPDNTGATLGFRTVAGSSNVDEPFRRVGRRRWQLGNGEGPQIEVATVAGDLNVDASFTSRLINGEAVSRYAEMAPIAPTPATPPSPPAAPSAPAAPASPSVFTSDDPLAFAPPAPDEADFLDSTAEEDAPAPQRTPEEAARIALLEAVARGELDIEEALRRLDGAE